MSTETDKTVWELIMDALKSHKIEAYPPATKHGECKSPYVVVKGDGAAQISNFSSQSNYYTFLIYAPINKYQELQKFKEVIKGICATDLYPMLMPTGQETPDFYDDTVKAHMVSVTYRNSVRNNHL